MPGYMACPVYRNCLRPTLCAKGAPCPPEKKDKKK